MGTGTISGAIPPREPIAVGHDRQLFLDDYVIAERTNVRLVLHPPIKHARNPVLLPDRPWEADSVAVYGTVIYDEQDEIFKMWYRAMEDTCYVCYATSSDGIHWDKPVLNAASYKGSTENNIVLGSVSPKFYVDGFAVIKDLNDGDPKRRYKMLTYNGDRRFAAMISPDGIRWSGPINRGESPDTGDVISLYYDSELGKYVALLKRRFTDDGGAPVRARLISLSEDFVSWTEPGFNLIPDSDDPPSAEFYSQVAYMYEGMRVGYVTVFVKATELIHTQLCYSRDGLKWHRYRERAQFPPNAAGTFDAGMLIAGASGLIVRDGKIWIYYAGYSVDHEGRPHGESKVPNGIGLAHVRRDGFVSAESGETAGTLLTERLICSGADLRINAEAPRGEIRAELVGVDGRAVPGHDLASSVVFRGDSLDAQLGWAHKSLRDMIGEPLRIRFQLRNAGLYSFWFSED